MGEMGRGLDHRFLRGSSTCRGRLPCADPTGLSLRLRRCSSRFDKVRDGLPASPELRFALAHVVAQRHVAASRVIQHPLQDATGNEFLGDACERRTQAMPLHCGSGLRVDPGQRLACIHDCEQGLVGLPVQTVAFRYLERLLDKSNLWSLRFLVSRSTILPPWRSASLTLIGG